MEEPKKKSWRKYLIFISLGAILVLTGWLYYRYWFVYSEGTRVGIIYKFSKKGTIFKTYEGEMLLPGLSNKRAATQNISTNNFFFSVTNETLADSLMKIQGMEVEMHYVFYRRPLPWRGDSYEGETGQYIVDKLIRIKNKDPNGYGM